MFYRCGRVKDFHGRDKLGPDAHAHAHTRPTAPRSCARHKNAGSRSAGPVEPARRDSRTNLAPTTSRTEHNRDAAPRMWEVSRFRSHKFPVNGAGRARCRGALANVLGSCVLRSVVVTVIVLVAVGPPPRRRRRHSHDGCSRVVRSLHITDFFHESSTFKSSEMVKPQFLICYTPKAH
ncbi:hypothetical protein EVAR_33328_1 [Eumeta japonica]|uniref:Uncharacterized protein n=1 Tax=Eumeta variegata TaxID=151549 RepID=A0A4C1WHV5_EUMVA|nr:hypothetical protein EVAR_33328_1 [Eumeta japonica]